MGGTQEVRHQALLGFWFYKEGSRGASPNLVLFMEAWHVQLATHASGVPFDGMVFIQGSTNLVASWRKFRGIQAAKVVGSQ